MSASIIQTKDPHPIELKDLLSDLADLVEWETFGGLLGVPANILRRIKANDAELTKRVLHLCEYLLELDDIKDLSWKKIIEALQKIPEEKGLANKLSKKYDA
uniref:Death domain-containing protein n=1 Tax=Amphimedon queenslandica TaxID=400682 RepID=A0A1X7VS70_AMPQE